MFKKVKKKSKPIKIGIATILIDHFESQNEIICDFVVLPIKFKIQQ